MKKLTAFLFALFVINVQAAEVNIQACLDGSGILTDDPELSCVVVAPELNQCEDGIDNDGDGLIDLADPGCDDATDDDETDPAPPGEEFSCGPLVFNTQDRDQDIYPVDGINESHNRACSNNAPGPTGDCSWHHQWFQELEDRYVAAMETNIWGFRIVDGPFPAFAVNVPRVYLNFEPGASIPSLTINTNDVCVTGIPSEIVTFAPGTSGGYLNGVPQ